MEPFLNSIAEPTMTQIDLINLALSITSAITADFGQIITITFAMVIGIYYFLNSARLGMKIFAFIAYSIGMLMYFGRMIDAGNLTLGIIEQLSAIPQKDWSRPVAHFMAVRGSWVNLLTEGMINVGFWVLWVGIFWLLFFWKKEDRSGPSGPTT